MIHAAFDTAGNSVVRQAAGAPSPIHDLADVPDFAAAKLAYWHEPLPHRRRRTGAILGIEDMANSFGLTLARFRQTIVRLEHFGMVRTTPTTLHVRMMIPPLPPLPPLPQRWLERMRFPRRRLPLASLTRPLSPGTTPSDAGLHSAEHVEDVEHKATVVVRKLGISPEDTVVLGSEALRQHLLHSAVIIGTGRVEVRQDLVLERERHALEHGKVLGAVGSS